MWHHITLFVVLLVVQSTQVVEGNPYADQLYEDLLYYYQKSVRPVVNASESLMVQFGASLIRIIDVDEKNQVFTTNLWLEMRWMDQKLQWDPKTYGHLGKLHVPSDVIWTPDILLYNNADGDPHVTIMNDAMVYSDGTVVWKPPAIFKSFCEINIEYFPYDIQTCLLKFGGWSHDGFFMDMAQLPVTPGLMPTEMVNREGAPMQCLELGMDLSYFHQSAEWDLINLTSCRHEVKYGTCCGQTAYVDVTFSFDIRRKPLFYTINIVIPCMLIAFLTTVVFYLPSDSRAKISFAISILVTLTVFYLVLIDLIPPTSLVIPLMGKYLLFTMMLVSVSIFVTVITLNQFYRNGATHHMPPWVKHVFINFLPRYLFLKPQQRDDEAGDGADDGGSSSLSESFGRKISASSRRPSPYFLNVQRTIDDGVRLSSLALSNGLDPDVVRRMIANINFIAEHFQAMDDENEVTDDWSMVSLVLDRIFLLIFSMGNVMGTIVILMKAPSLFDPRVVLDTPYPIKPLGGDTFTFLLANESGAA